LSPSSQYDRVFQIKTTFNEFDSSREWCLTAEFKEISSKLYVRPCKSYADIKDNLQLFASDEYGQLKLAGPSEGFCVASTSRLVEFDNCESNVNERKQITVGTDGRLTQYKGGQTYLFGFDPDKRFSRLRLYKLGSFNESLDKWSVVYGLAALPEPASP